MTSAMTSAADVGLPLIAMVVSGAALALIVYGFVRVWRRRPEPHVGHHRPTTVVPYVEHYDDEPPTTGLPLAPLEHQRLGIHGGQTYIRPPQPDAANVEATKWQLYQRALPPVKAVAHIDARRRAATGGWNRVSDYLKAVVR